MSNVEASLHSGDDSWETPRKGVNKGITAALAALFVAGGATGVYLLTSGGSPSSTGSGVVAGAHSRATHSASPSATPSASATPDKTAKLRNPFISQLAKRGGVAVAPVVAPAPVPVPTAVPVPVPVVVPPPAASPVPTAPSPAATSSQHTVNGNVRMAHSVTTGQASCADVSSTYTVKVIGSDNSLQSETPVASSGAVTHEVTENGATSWTCDYPFVVTVDGTASPYTFALIGKNDTLIDATSVTLESLSTPVVLTVKAS